MVVFRTYPHEKDTFRSKLAAPETALDLLILGNYVNLEQSRYWDCKIHILLAGRLREVAIQ